METESKFLVESTGSQTPLPPPLLTTLWEGRLYTKHRDKGGSHLYDPIYGMGCGGEYFPGFHLCNFLRLNNSFVREFKGLRDQTKKGFPEKFLLF